MLRCATTAVLAVLASVSLVSAADKVEKPKKPTGTWTHTVQDMTVTLTFEDETLRCEVTNSSGARLAINASYGVNADGVAFGIVNHTDKKGTDEGPDKGILFSFGYKMDKDVLTISDLNASTGVSDEGRNLLQGEYKAKK